MNRLLATVLVSVLLVSGCVSVKTETGGNIMKVTSSAFGNGENIPQKYTADGENVNPPISIRDIPEGTKSLVLIVDDPDAPGGTWDHWIVFNIPPGETINENSVPGTEGRNDFGKNSYGGPAPPSGTHRYFFRVYALDRELDLPAGSTKEQVLEAMENHIIGRGELMGTYSRKQ